jgi:hypothetical protein
MFIRLGEPFNAWAGFGGYDYKHFLCSLVFFYP